MGARDRRSERGDEQIPLALVDPDAMRREGLSAIARRIERLRIRAAAPTVDALPKRMAASTVAAVALPSNGLSSVTPLPDLPTILFAESFTDAELMGAIRLGAQGILLMPCSALYLECAATAVTKPDGVFIDPGIAGRVVAAGFRGQPGEGPHGLTTQERRVLAKLPQGLTNREIGDELGISHETVKSHVRSACNKIGARDRYHAAEIVGREGMDNL